MSNQTSTKEDFYKFFAHCNLNMHIKHYNEHKRLVENEIVWINKKLQQTDLDDQAKSDLNVTKQIYQSSYHDYMIINCFLMMHAHLEECFAVTFQLFPSGTAGTEGTGLNRFKSAFLSKYSIQITQGPRWPFLQDCAQIRDVLLHAAGNITLVKDRDKIDPVVKRNPTLVTLSKHRIFLRPEILKEYSSAISDFVDWLTEEIKKQHNNSMQAPPNGA